MTLATTNPSSGKAPLSNALGYLRGAMARMTGVVQATPAQPFITVSNTRAGASWLAANLAALDDVDVDCEVKWRPPFQPQPMHIALESGADDLLERLNEISRGRPVVGSRLVLDPYQPFMRDELDELLSVIDPSTRIVHVTRSYFEMLKGVESRGGAARATDTAIVSGVSEKLSETEMFKALTAASKAPQGEQMFSAKPAAALAKTLLVLFINDLVCAKICAHVGPENARRVRYETRQESFGDIAGFLGSSAKAAKVQAVMQRPVVEAYPEIDDSFAPHFKLLVQIAKELDAVRDAVLDGAFDIDDVWRDETPPLHLPQKIGVLLSMISALDVPTDIGLGQKLKAGLGI